MAKVQEVNANFVGVMRTHGPSAGSVPKLNHYSHRATRALRPPAGLRVAWRRVLSHALLGGSPICSTLELVVSIDSSAALTA